MHRRIVHQPNRRSNGGGGESEARHLNARLREERQILFEDLTPNHAGQHVDGVQTSPGQHRVVFVVGVQRVELVIHRRGQFGVLDTRKRHRAYNHFLPGNQDDSGDVRRAKFADKVRVLAAPLGGWPSAKILNGLNAEYRGAGRPHAHHGNRQILRSSLNPNAAAEG